MFSAQRKREALGRGTPKILPRALQHTRCENVRTTHNCTRTHAVGYYLWLHRKGEQVNQEKQGIWKAHSQARPSGESCNLHSILFSFSIIDSTGMHSLTSTSSIMYTSSRPLSRQFQYIQQGVLKTRFLPLCGKAISPNASRSFSLIAAS